MELRSPYYVKRGPPVPDWPLYVEIHEGLCEQIEEPVGIILINSAFLTDVGQIAQQALERGWRDATILT